MSTGFEKTGLAVLAAVLTVGLAGGTAQAQRLSKVNGSKLLSLCSAASASNCDAYLSGIADAIASEGKANAAACIPVNVTGIQLREVVKKFLRDHPQDLEKPAGELATHAFGAAFSCK